MTGRRQKLYGQQGRRGQHHGQHDDLVRGRAIGGLGHSGIYVLAVHARIAALSAVSGHQGQGPFSSRLKVPAQEHRHLAARVRIVRAVVVASAAGGDPRTVELLDPRRVGIAGRDVVEDARGGRRLVGVAAARLQEEDRHLGPGDRGSGQKMPGPQPAEIPLAKSSSIQETPKLPGGTSEKTVPEPAGGA